jgi:hypothetical protein
MILNKITYNSFKEEVKALAEKHEYGSQFISWVDHCGFETNPLKNSTLKSIELTNEIVMLLNDEKYSEFKVILNKIPEFANCCDIGDLYSLWHIIYIKCSNPVLIIGAGVSGLTIASKIENPLLVLEARDRIGGRVFTSDSNIDMGAAWLHGSDQNPLNAFLDFNNLIPVSKCNPWMHSEKTAIEYMSSTQHISEDKRQQLATKWNNLASKMASIPNKTIIEAFEQLTSDDYNHDFVLMNNEGSDECKDYDLDDDLSSFLYMIEVWCGGSVKTLSTDFLKIDSNATTNTPQYNNALFGDYGGSHYLFKNGAKTLIDALINSSIIANLRDYIKCSQIVTNINYNSYYVEVLTRTGQVYYCDKLCITIPPGPLRNICFNPPLETNKANALSKIKMGSYKKIQIEFAKEDVFWKTNVPMFLTYNPKTNGAKYYLNNDNKAEKENEDVCPYILWNNYKYSKNKPILEAICPANIGWNLARQPDEEIIETMLRQLQNYYPVVPEPKA